MVPGGRPNRTFVLLFPKCHLGTALTRGSLLKWLNDRLGEVRDIVRSNEVHLSRVGWDTKLSIQTLTKQEPLVPPKVASRLDRPLE